MSSHQGSDSSGFQIIRHRRGTEIRLSEIAPIDTPSQYQAADEMLEYVKREQPQNLVVNCAAVHRCTTVAINGLLELRRHLAGSSADARLKLCEVQKEVRQTLEVLNLAGTIFELHDCLEDALNAP